MINKLSQVPEAGSAYPLQGGRQAKRFYIGFAIAILLAVFAGFSKSFFFRSHFGLSPLSLFIFLHALIFTGWIFLLLAQTMLVRWGRVDRHRRVGVAGGLLALAMMVNGYFTAVAAARRGYIPASDILKDPLAGLIVPLRDLVFFSAFTFAGLYYRHHAETHKRLLLLATINLLPAAFGRIPGGAIVLPLMLAFLLSVPVHDHMMHGRIHRMYVWGGLLTLVSLLVQFPLAMTGLWHTIARLLI